ncbi:MAG: cupin domain-containing protein [Burkholderiales bacterium]
MVNDIKPIRRIVVRDDNDGTRSRALCDAPSPDVRTDPARPGFAATRLWVTDRTPARVQNETLNTAHTIEPPKAGSLCRYLQIPPDDAWKGKVGSKEVRAYFASMGSPGASTYSGAAPHPYMQKTRTLDFALIIEGDVTLVLDLEEVHLSAGDTVVLRGTSHAWSNRSSKPCIIAMSMHDGL